MCLKDKRTATGMDKYPDKILLVPLYVRGLTTTNFSTLTDKCMANKLSSYQRLYAEQRKGSSAC